MGEEANQLKDQIEARRQRMGGTFDAIEDRVMPGRVVDRQQARVSQRWSSIRERVMGTPEPEFYSTSAQYDSSQIHPAGSDSTGTTEQAKQKASQFADSAQSTAQDVRAQASDVLDTMQDTPQIVRRKTEGNPLAAGAIAFGLGALIGTFVPETELEKDAVSRIEPQIRDTADQIRESATEVASNVQSEAKDKAEELKSSAKSSAENVKGQAQSAAEDVKDKAQSEAQDVKSEADAHRDGMTS